MPLQDLTPQLRTRLNRMERAVGWFITIATFILIAGFAYYLYNTAEQRGWFALKAHYYTYADSGTGLKEGDRVNLMGFDVGAITKITAMDPGAEHNVYVEFEVLREYYGYLWTEGSRVKFRDAGFLGKRELDLTTGTNGLCIYLNQTVAQMTPDQIKQSPNLAKLILGQDVLIGTNRLAKTKLPLAAHLNEISAWGLTNIWVIDTSHTNSALTAIWNESGHHYEKVTKKSHYGLPPEETPALTDRLAAVVQQVQTALPGILQLTNQVSLVLSNAAQATSNLNIVLAEARPTVTNLAAISANLRNPKGSLGEWLIPTNLSLQLDSTLVSARTTLTNVDTNLLTLNRSLDNFANITSNLNNQVQANTNILSNISNIIVHTDEFIQGLKKFWLFRHLFAAHPAPGATPPAKPREPLVSPKQKGQ